MATTLFLRRFIAIAQKTKSSSTPFGEGHNVEVHAGFRVQGKAEEAPLNAALDKVLKTIDHRALGVDVDLGVDPELSRLAYWLLERLNEEGVPSACEIKLQRGDGVCASYFKQPLDDKSIEPPERVRG